MKHKYLNLNSLVLISAVFIALGFAWGSVNAMQRNYDLQREVNDKQQQLLIAELETETLEFEQRYYESREYQELEARKRLNLALPGEKVLVLPPNSQQSVESDKASSGTPSDNADDFEQSNIAQWMDFLLGGQASQTNS